MGVSLDNLVDITVKLTSLEGIQTNFDLGLIIGNSVGTTNAVHEYTPRTYANEMVQDGYATDSAEYKAVQRYFAQEPTPSRVLVGQTATGQTPVQTYQALRALDSRWYLFCFTQDTTDDQIQAVAAAVEAETENPAIYVYGTDDDSVITASSTNIFKTLKELEYHRSFGFYDTSGEVPAAIVGICSGLNTMEPDSAYTLAYKQLVGIEPEDITEAQYTALMGYNGNVYTSYGERYSLVYQGISAAGIHMDEIYAVDAARHLIQHNVVQGLIGERKVPQTEEGLTTIINWIADSCERMKRIGFINSGIWRGVTVKDLKHGMGVQNGYVIMADAMADQSDADRLARTTPPIYVCLVSTGAIEHVVIRVYISR